MATKSKVEWLGRSLLLSPYSYALCLNEDDFYAELKRLKIPERKWPDFIHGPTASATAHIFTTTKDGINSFVLVALRKQKGIKRVEIYGLLIHEAVHIWQAICRDIGEEYPSDEMEAYSIQKIAQELIHSYMEQIKR